MGSQRSSAKGARSGAAKAPSQRQLRVGEELRHAVSRILLRGDLHDPDLAGASVTVTEVRVSPDLKNATAFVVPLGGDGSGEVLAALNRAAAFLRSQLGREIHLRHTPRLSFQADHSFDEAAKINALLHNPRVQRDVEAPPQDDSAPDRGALDDGSLQDGPAMKRPDDGA